jgi:hypothetical protein
VEKKKDMPLETTPYLAGLTSTLSGPVGIAFSLTLWAR